MAEVTVKSRSVCQQVRSDFFRYAKDLCDSKGYLHNVALISAPHVYLRVWGQISMHLPQIVTFSLIACLFRVVFRMFFNIFAVFLHEYVL